MIAFDLECINGHTFEGWFGDGNDFMDQQARGMIACPVCETYSVVQKLSPVAVKRSSGVSFDGNARQDVLAELSAKIVNFVENNFENVGSDFAREALKIHYGVTEPKNIRGITTAEEDKLLKKEGVPVVSLGTRPENEKEELN
ncbi:MAG: DUF1178 family protein [Desulfamplus sp.]|nr:DUF1178 family protein [Desulfamplus sp.]